LYLAEKIGFNEET